jgi:hypothetical protein
MNQELLAVTEWSVFRFSFILSHPHVKNGTVREKRRQHRRKLFFNNDLSFFITFQID